MIFNITLLVQMIHFGIAFVLLHYLFFLPLLRLVEQKKAVTEKKEQAIMALEDFLVTLKKQQRKELDALHAHFITHQPKILISEKITATSDKVAPHMQTQEDVAALYRFREAIKELFNQKLHG